MRKMLLGLSLLVASHAQAAAASAQVTPLSLGSVFSVIFGLFVVLALLFGTAWLVRRLQRLQTATPGILQPIAQQQLGLKERVMLLRIDQENILIACTGNGIRTLHTWQGPLPQGLSAATVAANTAPFVEHLKRLLAERRP
ncbi:MAG: flagellar biosynthetic protein FliO [Pseudomonadota bacterium]